MIDFYARQSHCCCAFNLTQDRILEAFRAELTQGDGRFEFVFYPEVEGGSISNFLSRLLSEVIHFALLSFLFLFSLNPKDDVSPEHRKAIQSCKNQLSQCDFMKHPYYPLPLPAWKVLGLPQCQMLLRQNLSTSLQLSIDFKMSRIGVARVGEDKSGRTFLSLMTIVFRKATAGRRPISVPRP